MRINENGNVGIGKSLADALLEVSASGGTSDLFMLSSNDANDGDRFIVKNSGGVGIGITNPQSKLHVNGTIQVGDGTKQVNMTFTSPNGKEWTCGVDDNGAFLCS